MLQPLRYKVLNRFGRPTRLVGGAWVLDGEFGRSWPEYAVEFSPAQGNGFGSRVQGKEKFVVMLEKIDYSESAGMGSHPHVKGSEVKDFKGLIAGHAFLQETKPRFKLGNICRAQGLGRVGQSANDFGFDNGRGGCWRRSWRDRWRFVLFGGTARDAAGNQK
jgi:hypothetical protein